MNKDHVPAFTLVPPKRAIETNQAPASRTPRFIDDIAAGRVELPTIPSVVQQLMAARLQQHGLILIQAHTELVGELLLLGRAPQALLERAHGGLDAPQVLAHVARQPVGPA